MSIVLSLGTPTRTVIQNTVTRRGVVKVKYRFCGSCGACSRNVQVRQMTVTVVLTRGASMNRCSDVRWPANPDRKVDIKDNHLGIKLIPMISTWDQVDPTFPVRVSSEPRIKNPYHPHRKTTRISVGMQLSMIAKHLVSTLFC
jgi:hypothetical protein